MSNPNVDRLLKFRSATGATLLGVGPMSLNCVDAAIELANEHQVFLMVIASRRQIDSAEFGGGYVNNWTTEQFAAYVREHDAGRYIVLARDHGGPWQNERETQQEMALEAAMASAKRSFEADIEAGFDVIHIDPSHGPQGKAPPSVEDFVARTKELFTFCKETADHRGRRIAIEIGTDEGEIGLASAADIESMAVQIKAFCQKERLDLPQFLVIQTGTKVMEMRNVGPLDAQVQRTGDVGGESNLSSLLAIGERHGFVTKEHNADYISDATLQWHVRRRIGAANVAPEFGVTETKTFLDAVRKIGARSIEDRFLELAFNSRKWEKWMLPDTPATDRDRSIIAGHYVFATPAFCELHQDATQQCTARGLDLRGMLRDAVKRSMMRFIVPLGMLQQSKSA